MAKDHRPGLPTWLDVVVVLPDDERAGLAAFGDALGPADGRQVDGPIGERSVPLIPHRNRYHLHVVEGQASAT